MRQMAIGLQRSFNKSRRKLARELLATLDESEREIIGTVRRGLHVFGRPGDTAIVITRIVRLTPKTRSIRTDMIRSEDLAPVVNRLHRLGWLRFARMDNRDGYFWLTEAAESICDYAGASASDIWSSPAEREAAQADTKTATSAPSPKKSPR
jgi:hypothetical protein